MRQSSVNCLPIMENGHLVGVISEDAIRHAMERKPNEEQVPLTVGNYMLAPVKTLESDSGDELPGLLKDLLKFTEAKAFVRLKSGETLSIWMRDEVLRAISNNDFSGLDRDFLPDGE